VRLSTNRRTGAIPPLALTVLAVVAVAQVVSWAYRPWYPMTLALSLLVLDAMGVFYLLRVARLGINRLSCRLGAAARGLGAGNALALIVWLIRGGDAWWWLAAGLHIAGMALLGTAVIVGPLSRLSGPHRQAFAAEIVAIAAPMAMIVWCVGLDPSLWQDTADQDSANRTWIILAGLPVADLLLAMAVAAMLLRGMINGWRDPITVLVSGMALAILTDTTWAARLPGDVTHLVGAAGGTLVVVAHLLLTLSPLMSASGVGSVIDRPPRTGPPRWVPYLPLASLVTGVALLLAVIASADGWQRWSGLIVSTIVMIAAVAFRQWLTLRASQAQASRDPATGLTSRDGMKEAIARAVRGREQFAVLAVTFRPSPSASTGFGGAVAALRASVRAGDLVGRLGDDTFGVLLADAGAADEALTVAHRILAEVDGAPVLPGDPPETCSIGVAVARPDEPAKTVLRHAEIAMSHARRAGGSGYAVHDPTMSDRRAADAALDEALEGALARGEFTVVYQPIVDLATRRIVAAEALLRWRHPLHGDVSPAAFIPVAERSGEIVGIGRWVLEQACLQVAAWQRAGADLSVTVNVSPRQLQERGLPQDVLAVLQRTGVAPASLVIEVTESAMVHEAVEVGALRELRSHGIRIAVDDFGTGYSSLQYLTRLPVDVLKIDRSFVGQLDGTAESAAIAEAIIRLAQVLRLTTVAEGIENEQQAAELLQLGSERGQGYLFARPVPPDQLLELAEISPAELSPASAT
jgi:EAL domain-containing protein (putative c-di-GMP-specific phosphodiesterase class I)/GGDEF domain-containing protein